MKTEDTMDTKKKVYSTPELVEHGTLSKATHGTGDDFPRDAFPAPGFSGMTT